MPSSMFAGSSARIIAALILLSVLVPTAHSQSFSSSTLPWRIEKAIVEGKYAELLPLSRQWVQVVEKHETATTGKLGGRTAQALGELAFHALLSRHPSEALAAAQRASRLAPNELWIAMYRAHALLLIGRTGDAARIYLAHRGKRLPSGQLWQDDVEIDFDKLALAGVKHPAIPRVLRSLGQKLSKTGVERQQLANRFRQYIMASEDYPEALKLAQRHVELTRQRFGTRHMEYVWSLDRLWKTGSLGNASEERRRIGLEALASAEKVLGPDHPLLIERLHELTTHFVGDKGAPLAQRALAIAEKVHGPRSPALTRHLEKLAMTYLDDRAEPVYLRMLSICEEAAPKSPCVFGAYNHLIWLYTQRDRQTGAVRDADAATIYKRLVELAERTYGSEHAQTVKYRTDFAKFYWVRGRYVDAQPLLQRNVDIAEKNPRLNLSAALEEFATLAKKQLRFDEAAKLLQRVADMQPTIMNHSAAAAAHFEVGDWKSAVDGWRKSTSALVERFLTVPDEPYLQWSRAAEHRQQKDQFLGLIRALYRTEGDPTNIAAALVEESFKLAQWAQDMSRSLTLAQVAARGGKGDPKLAVLVQERQAWEDKQEESVGPNQPASALFWKEREQAIAAIDVKLRAEFPEYFKLIRPNALSVGEVQAELKDDEALVIAIDATEIYVWVVTKTEARWVRSPISGAAVRGYGSALLCGLKASIWEDPYDIKSCKRLVSTEPTRDADGNVMWESLPFDLIRANAMYRALFGQIEDTIEGKHVLIPQFGFAARIPFHLLVTKLPADVVTTQTKEAGRLGAELEEIPVDLHWRSRWGARVVKVLPDSAAEIAGLREDDVIVSVNRAGGKDVAEVIRRVRAIAPGKEAVFHIDRGGTKTNVVATLQATNINVMAHRYLRTETDRDIAWFASQHPVTILPNVLAIKTLRQDIMPSNASRPMLGVGNPLLDGNASERPGEDKLAELARQKQSCAAMVAAAPSRTVVRAPKRAKAERLANVDFLRSQPPLPETADELCAAATANNVGEEHVLLGSRATESAIKQLNDTGQLAQYRVLHFASHAVLASQMGEQSRMRAGIILTPPQAGNRVDDGYLESGEIKKLRLDADWVILSACNSADSGDGLFGGTYVETGLGDLPDSFFSAGARSLLVSHWAVSSEATTRLISATVEATAASRGKSSAEALRSAMMEMASSESPYLRHPAFWAPFIILGDGSARR